MKRIITLNAIILFVYFLLSNVFLEWKDDYLVDHYAGEFQNFTFSSPVNVVNTGTSHGSVSFDWKSQKIVNGVNLGRSGQPFSSDLLLLNKYSSYIKDAVVVIPISFHSFCLGGESYTPVEGLFEENLPFLGIVQSTISIDLLRDSREDRSFPADDFPNYSLVTPSISPRLDCEASIIDTNIDLLIEVVKNYNVVLVTTPYYTQSLREPEAFTQFYEIINGITDLYDVKYIDYSRDVRFNDHEYFYNATHLNTKGRQLFTEIFTDEVLLFELDKIV